MPPITIEIAVNDIVRTYKGDYNFLHSKDWNEVVQDMLDGLSVEEKGE